MFGWLKVNYCTTSIFQQSCWFIDKSGEIALQKSQPVVEKEHLTKLPASYKAVKYM